MLLCACAFVLVATEHQDAQSPLQPTTRSPVSIPSEHEPRNAAATPPAPRPLPAAAIEIAARYARLTFSTTAGVSTDTWINAATPLCTAMWLAHLRTATNGGSATTTQTPRVLRIFASWAPSHELGATVLLLNPSTNSYEAIYLDLKPFRDRYLVAAAQ